MGRTSSTSRGSWALRVTHRRYVPYSHAHYAGNLVDGAYSLGLFGDVATEVCIRTDGDEGLFASYSDVQFRAPVRAGDVLEITAEVVAVGSRSRTLELPGRGGRPGAARTGLGVGRGDARRAGRRDHRDGRRRGARRARDAPVRRVGCTTRRRGQKIWHERRDVGERAADLRICANPLVSGAVDSHPGRPSSLSGFHRAGRRCGLTSRWPRDRVGYHEPVRRGSRRSARTRRGGHEQESGAQ